MAWTINGTGIIKFISIFGRKLRNDPTSLHYAVTSSIIGLTYYKWVLVQTEPKYF